MIKRSPSRNTRSKGVKVKNVLQICVLLAVCFWLIYQVKHSHDKKKEFDEKDAKVSVRSQTGNDILKLGRKDPHPRIQDVTNNDKHEEDEEEEPGLEELLKEEKEQEERTKQKEDQQEERSEEKEGEEDSKNTEEEEQEEEETKNQDTEDEGLAGGDDEIDEHEQEKTVGTDHEEDLIDEEKEREEETEEKENESNLDEDKGAQMDQETPTEDQDHDEVGGNSHEAREEHYKADDASSAVTHDTQIISTELEKENTDNSNENSARNDLEVDGSNGNNSEDDNEDKPKSTLDVGHGRIPDSSPSLNVTVNDKKDDVITYKNTDAKDQSPKNATSTSLTDDQSVLSIKPTEINAEAKNGNNSTGGSQEKSDSLQNHEKVAVPDFPAQSTAVDGKTTGEITTLQITESGKVNNSTVSDGTHSDSKLTFPTNTENAGINGTQSFSSSSNSNSDASDSTFKMQVTTETEVNSGSSEILETADAHHDTTTLAVVNNESGETDSQNKSGGDNVKNESAETDSKNESGETDEKLDASAANVDDFALTNDPIDTTDLQLAKESRIDLGTLPDDTSITEGVNTRDSAAE